MTKKLKTLKLSEVIPYDNNPRINDSAVEAVKESIKQCEYIAPIIVDENNKFRYVFCFDKKLRKKYLKLAQPYPKDKDLTACEMQVEEKRLSSK